VESSLWWRCSWWRTFDLADRVSNYAHGVEGWGIPRGNETEGVSPTLGVGSHVLSLDEQRNVIRKAELQSALQDERAQEERRKERARWKQEQQKNQQKQQPQQHKTPTPITAPDWLANLLSLSFSSSSSSTTDEPD